MRIIGPLILVWLCAWTVARSEQNHTNITRNLSRHLVFDNFRDSHHDIKLLGHAVLSAESGFIQIPQAGQSNISFMVGRALYSSPVRMLDTETGRPASFKTTFSFQIDSDNNSYTNPGGSGFTFIIVPDEVTVGRPGLWLGMLNDACEEDYKAFAVEFDTFQNEEFGDPNDNHVGINLGSIISNTTIDASTAGISFKNGNAVRAWIDYNGDRKWIHLGLGLEEDLEPRKIIYTAPLDISGFLKEYMFVGFSASTGHHTQIHNIRSWGFKSISKGFAKFPKKETCEAKMLLNEITNLRRPSNTFLVFIAVVVLCLLTLINLYCNRKRPEKSKRIETALVLRPRPPNKPRKFSMSELSLATRSFTEGLISGSSGSGTFFKGLPKNGCDPVAIKRINSELILKLERRKIMKEVKDLCKLKPHPHLVPLRGWCSERNELILIYDYMHNGSLDKWLFSGAVLAWSRRFQVLKDVADGLWLLHCGSEKKIIHKNVKVSNVLLDISFRAALGDFGLFHCHGRKQNSEGLINVVESNQDIFYPETGCVETPSDKTDIYGYGVLILETLSGKRNAPSQEADLIKCAWNVHDKDELDKIVDKRLGRYYNSGQVVLLAKIALFCTLDDPNIRPSMDDIISYITGKEQLSALPSKKHVLHLQHWS